ncbi:MAG TPA: alternative ribosome rescue aminoacyl-tRNA hydrolase ArfB [Flavitalea sp.]|nr:alternative ribosome rescue aminoacyl-tRNA hydrolase ArfB [Flavitalea sp.]
MALPIDISAEIRFKTARSGGKGGQNVNKVESMVEGSLDIRQSSILNDDQKAMVLQKLRNRINLAGELQVRSQMHRSQLSNKTEVIRKMAELIERALKKEKPRLASRPTVASKKRRLESKKINSEHKQNRRRIKE